MDPYHQFASPEFQVVANHFPNGSLNTVTVTPIRRQGNLYDDVAVFADIARALQAAVIAELGNMTQAQRSNVVGSLMMNNINDAHHTMNDRTRLADITQQLINETFYRAKNAESNPDITLYDVEWVYWVNPISLAVVGSSCPHVEGVYKKTTKCPKVHNLRPPGCLASACAFGLIKLGFGGSNANHNLSNGLNRQWIKLALHIQDTLNWETENQETRVEELLTLYPTLRIVILYRTLNGPSRIYKGAEWEDKTLFLGRDHVHKHIFTISAPQTFLSTGYHSRFCNTCCYKYAPGQTCSCGESSSPPLKYYNCKHCGIDYHPKSRHLCGGSSCTQCRTPVESGAMSSHRCPIWTNSPKMPGKFIDEPWYDFEEEENPHRKDSEYKLWVYDLESCLVPTEVTTPSYQVNSEGYFETTPSGIIPMIRVVQNRQVPNLVVYKNVFSNDPPKVTSNLTEFLQEMTESNEGKNIVIAHNASGYDARLLFDHFASYLPSTVRLEPLTRGTKFMRLQIGNTIFQDSLLHIQGSLSSLADDFLKGTAFDLEKGEFPHFFNRAENFPYKGPLPDDKYFDLKYTIKNQKALDKHNRIRKSWEGRIWDAEEQLKLYCINDVNILAEVVRLHHIQCIKMVAGFNPLLAFSPWHSVTAAGYMHKLFLQQEKIYFNVDPKTLLTRDEINDIAAYTWIALEPVEHYFIKHAFRGGRTEVRKFYHKGPVKCLDVHSMYPSIQLGQSISVMGQDIPLLFPVGPPIIEVHDDLYTPCHIHCTDTSLDPCTCTTRRKRQDKLSITYVDPVDIHAYINDFFGVLLVDVTPPNLFHPLLPVYDDKQKKCIFSCDPIERKAFLSPMLQVAIANGYVVTKIYRADRYKPSESKWKGILGEMYKIKYYAGQDQASIPQELQDHHKTLYTNRFNIDLDFTQCKYMPAMKKSSKVLINSPWGKHAESVDHDQSASFGEAITQDSLEFYQRIDKGQYELKQIHQITTSLNLFKYKEKRHYVNPNLHKGYLPCAVFVPMYGQLMVWNHLNQLGKRVIMCDTDSIKYYDTGTPNEYQIPPGNALGEWEDEGTLSEFVSIGLKSYGLKYPNGKEEIKLKGVSLKRSHNLLINFETMQGMLNDSDIIDVPQLSFDYKFGQGIRTREFIKEVKFDERILKGNYDAATHTLYPYGFITF